MNTQRIPIESTCVPTTTTTTSSTRTKSPNYDILSSMESILDSCIIVQSIQRGSSGSSSTNNNSSNNKPTTTSSFLPSSMANLSSPPFFAQTTTPTSSMSPKRISANKNHPPPQQNKPLQGIKIECNDTDPFLPYVPSQENTNSGTLMPSQESKEIMYRCKTPTQEKNNIEDIFQSPSSSSPFGSPPSPTPATNITTTITMEGGIHNQSSVLLASAAAQTTTTIGIQKRDALGNKKMNGTERLPSIAKNSIRNGNQNTDTTTLRTPSISNSSHRNTTTTKRTTNTVDPLAEKKKKNLQRKEDRKKKRQDRFVSCEQQVQVLSQQIQTLQETLQQEVQSQKQQHALLLTQQQQKLQDDEEKHKKYKQYLRQELELWLSQLLQNQFQIQRQELQESTNDSIRQFCTHIEFHKQVFHLLEQGLQQPTLKLHGLLHDQREQLYRHVHEQMNHLYSTLQEQYLYPMIQKYWDDIVWKNSHGKKMTTIQMKNKKKYNNSKNKNNGSEEEDERKEKNDTESHFHVFATPQDLLELEEKLNTVQESQNAFWQEKVNTLSHDYEVLSSQYQSLHDECHQMKTSNTQWNDMCRNQIQELHYSHTQQTQQVIESNVQSWVNKQLIMQETIHALHDKYTLLEQQIMELSQWKNHHTCCKEQENRSDAFAQEQENECYVSTSEKGKSQFDLLKEKERTNPSHSSAQEEQTNQCRSRSTSSSMENSAVKNSCIPPIIDADKFAGVDPTDSTINNKKQDNVPLSTSSTATKGKDTISQHRKGEKTHDDSFSIHSSNETFDSMNRPEPNKNRDFQCKKEYQDNFITIHDDDSNDDDFVEVLEHPSTSERHHADPNFVIKSPKVVRDSSTDSNGQFSTCSTTTSGSHPSDALREPKKRSRDDPMSDHGEYQKKMSSTDHKATRNLNHEQESESHTTFSRHGSKRGKIYNYMFDEKSAFEVQERLLRESASRVRAQEEAQRKLVKEREGVPTFIVPFDDLTKLPQYHWRWSDMYARLGLPPKSSEELIKKHYRKLCLIYHPDKARGGADDENAERFQGIKEAYEILMSKL